MTYPTRLEPTAGKVFVSGSHQTLHELTSNESITAEREPETGQRARPVHIGKDALELQRANSGALVSSIQDRVIW
jgi:hypothetical protein